MHFCQLRKMHNDDLLIKLEDTEIPAVNEYKFLKVIFDRKLSFIPQLKYLETKTTRSQQQLRVVAHTKWGADRQALLMLYRALIRCQLDYSIFSRSTRKSYLKKLYPIHHESLRLVLVAFRTSPVVSLYTEAHKAPRQLRCEKLALQYYTKLKSSPSTTASSTANTNNSMNQKKKKHQTICPSDGAHSPRICHFCYKCT